MLSLLTQDIPLVQLHDRWTAALSVIEKEKPDLALVETLN
jgi:hypothetical protein